MEAGQAQPNQIVTIESIQRKIKSIDDFLFVFGTQLRKSDKATIYPPVRNNLALHHSSARRNIHFDASSKHPMPPSPARMRGLYVSRLWPELAQNREFNVCFTPTALRGVPNRRYFLLISVQFTQSSIIIIGTDKTSSTSTTCKNEWDGHNQQ